MSRSRRTRRTRGARPAPPAPLTGTLQPRLDTAGSAAQRPTPRRRAASAGTAYVGGEILRVAGVSVACFGLLALLVAVDRLR